MIDREMLAIWCEAASRHRKARMMQAAFDADTRFPLLRMDPRTKEIRASPYIREITRAAETMLRCVQELGFSPTARPKLVRAQAKAAEDEPNLDDPWTKLRLLQGGKG